MKFFIFAVLLAAATPVLSYAKIPYDSLALENDKGKLFVIHKVDKQETLYSLLKRYKCKPAEIMAANPTIEANSTIFQNQVLRIPYKTEAGFRVTLPTPSNVVEESTVDKKVKADLKKAASQPKHLFHIVSNGETLYAIGKLYNIDVEKLRGANGMSDNNISVGQKLVVAANYKPSGPAAGDDDEAPAAKKIVARSPLETPDKPVPNAPRGVQVTEIGIATTIDASSSSTKSYAMHRFAPRGTVIKIKNDATGDVVMAKVIGKLQETGNNQNVLIRLSPGAFNKLRPRDSRIRAVVTYEMPPVNE